MTDDTPAYPRLVLFSLTVGEAKTLNECFGTAKWEPNREYQWTAADRRMLLEKMDDLGRMAKWPGTKSFDHNAAYRQEMLGRIARRLPV